MTTVHINIPGTQITLVLIIKGLVFEGPIPKTKDKWVPGICRTLHLHIFALHFSLCQFEVAGANLPKPCVLKLLSSPLLGPGLIARDAEEAPRTGTGRVAKTEIALVALCLSSLGQPEWTLLSKL